MVNTDPVRDWQIATVTSVHVETPRVKLFRLELPANTRFRAGQYFDVRLTAPDGYQAQRSYSVSSSPSDPSMIELAIELISDGEMSAYFHEFVELGDQIELRGPIGGHFTLSQNFIQPLLLIAGGTGLAPVISMLRQRQSVETTAPTVLMFSTRTEADILFRDELMQLSEQDTNFHLVITLTRSASGEIPMETYFENRRIDRPMIDSAINLLGNVPARAYICGGSGFVETIGNHLLDIGMRHDDVRTERFGP
jgi:ferredoxin-NADP reductase